MCQRFWLIRNALIQPVDKKLPNPKCKPKKQNLKNPGEPYALIQQMFSFALFLMMKMSYSCLRLHPVINDRYGKILNRKMIVKKSSKFISATKCKLSLHACPFFLQKYYILWKCQKPPESFTVSPTVLQRIVKPYIPEISLS